MSMCLFTPFYPSGSLVGSKPQPREDINSFFFPTVHSFFPVPILVRNPSIPQVICRLAPEIGGCRKNARLIEQRHLLLTVPFFIVQEAAS